MQFSGDYITWQTVELPYLRNFVILFNDDRGSFLQHVFANEPGALRPLAVAPGPRPSWADMLNYDDMDPDEKKLAMAELQLQNNLWTGRQEDFKQDEIFFRTFKSFLDDFLPLSWREALFPVNEDDYSNAHCSEIITAIVDRRD